MSSGEFDNALLTIAAGLLGLAIVASLLDWAHRFVKDRMRD